MGRSALGKRAGAQTVAGDLRSLAADPTVGLARELRARVVWD